eukprot:940040_1
MISNLSLIIHWYSFSICSFAAVYYLFVFFVYMNLIKCDPNEQHKVHCFYHTFDLVVLEYQFACFVIVFMLYVPSYVVVCSYHESMNVMFYFQFPIRSFFKIKIYCFLCSVSKIFWLLNILF